MVKAKTVSELIRNEFHKRLRREIVMVPIPKPSFMNHKIIEKNNANELFDVINEKQLHNLQFALHRVRFNS